MGGALLELVAVGKQDTHLIGNPQFSYFKAVYRRHTNFSIESVGQYFQESLEFGKKATCIIRRKGDLLSQMVLEIELPALESGVSWINGIGHHLIKSVDLEIGGELVDRQYGEYLDIYSELNMPAEKRDGYYSMVGKNKSYSKTTQEGTLKLYIPLRFWFCKDISYALPLVAMQISEVRVIIDARPFSECWYSGTSMGTTPSSKTITNSILYCDYIYLDSHERKKVAAAKEHKYLIEQVQIYDGNPVPANSSIALVDFHFNHPVKELIWVYQPDGVSTTNDWGNYSMTLDNDQVFTTKAEPIQNVEMKLNGTDRFDKRSASYFRLVQPYQYHTAISDKYIYCYSFSLKPEEYQPSGTINFSKIDSSTLHLEMSSSILAGQIKIYAINYNILKITGGMTGLMYSS
jgi:hypothetical protein